MEKLTIDDCKTFYKHYRNIFNENMRKDYLGICDVIPSLTLKDMYNKKDNMIYALFNKESDDNLLYKLADEYSKVTYYKDKSEKYLFKDIQNIKELSLSEDKTIERVVKYDYITEDLKYEDDNCKKIFLILFFYCYLYERIDFHQKSINLIYKDDLDYELIPISDDIFVNGEYIKYIYDKKKEISIIVDLDPTLIDLFIELQSKKLISSFSIRGNDDYIFDGMLDPKLLKHTFGFGKYFDLCIYNNPPISMLYSKCYDDKLIVNFDKDSIIFEELYNYSNVVGDYIITNIVHLTYINEKNNFYITHLDQEYAFYKENEYLERLKFKRVKGTGKKPYKTFKLNGCKIPFDYMCDDLEYASKKVKSIKTNILYFILDRCLIHKDLIEEYFSGLLVD